MADFCCGYGNITLEIVEELEAKGVEIEKMVGYDLSEEILEVARKEVTSSKITFVQKNHETEYD